MKILIDIPEAFEVDYNADRFADFTTRTRLWSSWKSVQNF